MLYYNTSLTSIHDNLDNIRFMKKNNYLEKLYNSKKPFIVYKVNGGYDLYTDFSKKIFLNNQNINKVFNKIKKN